MKIDPQYLAGFFDGEGTFKVYLQKAKHVDNHNMYPRHVVMLSQSGDQGLVLLEQIQIEYGGRVYEHLKAGQHRATKSAYKLYWRKEEAILMIKQILPYLRLKQEEAQIALDHLQRNR